MSGDRVTHATLATDGVLHSTAHCMPPIAGVERGVRSLEDVE